MDYYPLLFAKSISFANPYFVGLVSLNLSHQNWKYSYTQNAGSAINGTFVSDKNKHFDRYSEIHK